MLPKVAFICVHNACRSQIAEALARHFEGGVFECYSAGTETLPHINADAVRILRQMYNIDMEIAQYGKLLCDIPAVDIVITMGCNVKCPALPCKYRYDWGIPDPTGKDDAEFVKIIHEIRQKVTELAELVSTLEI